MGLFLLTLLYSMFTSLLGRQRRRLQILVSCLFPFVTDTYKNTKDFLLNRQ